MQRMFGQSYFTRGLSDGELRRAAEKALDVNARSSEGLTGLMFATLYGEPALAEALIAQGARLNLQSLHKKMTALHYSANALREPKSRDTGYILLDAYANPRFKNKYGQTPLHLIVSTDILSDRNKMAEWLIKNGADINAQNIYGDTIIHIAASMKNAEWLKNLLDTYGPLIDLRLKNKKRFTPYQYGQQLGYTYVKEELSKPLPELESATERFASGLTGLMIVIMKDDQKLLKKFIKNRQALNMQADDEFGNSALHIAILFKNFEALKMLINQGASLTTRNKKGEIPLQFSVRIEGPRKRIQVAQLFLAKDPQTMFAKNNQGDNFLHYIVRFDAITLLDYLIKKHKNLVAKALFEKNNALQTPLRLASQIRRDRIRKKLRTLRAQVVR